VKLSKLKKNEIGQIKDVHRKSVGLQVLGFVPGNTVEMIQPGNPAIVKVFDGRLGISKDYQDNILMENKE